MEGGADKIHQYEKLFAELQKELGSKKALWKGQRIIEEYYTI